MQDPLDTLRAAIRANTPITYLDAAAANVPTLNYATSIVLGASSFPRDTPTRLQRANAAVRLDAILFAWLARDASAADYIRQAREAGIGLSGAISNTERRAVAEWLEGKTEVLNGLVPLQRGTPPGTPPPSHAGLPTTSSTSPSKRHRDAADAEVVKRIKANEIELCDRSSVLHGSKAGNFTNVKTLYADRLKKLKEAAKTGGVLPPAAAQKIDPKAQARKAKNMQPIIMISSSPTSLITMYNVRRFLQDAVFESPSDARARATAEGSPKPEDMLPIYRDASASAGTHAPRYLVVDGVEALAKFGADAWERVVCVLTTGQAWQFKPYKWSEPKTLFHHVKGFYVSWANDPPNLKIKDWNVTELKIDPHRRHVDKSVVASFWKTLDAWTLANKPWLVKP